MEQRVLLLEDDRILSKLIRRHLQGQGLGATVVESCQAARQAVANCTFDLVLTDFRLPDCVGLDFVEELAALPGRPPVLIVTGEQRHVWERKALELGVEAYLRKPFPMGAVIHIARCLLEGERCFPRCSRGYEPHHGPNKHCPLNL